MRIATIQSQVTNKQNLQANKNYASSVNFGTRNFTAKQLEECKNLTDSLQVETMAWTGLGGFLAPFTWGASLLLCANSLGVKSQLYRDLGKILKLSEKEVETVKLSASSSLLDIKSASSQFIERAKQLD